MFQVSGSVRSRLRHWPLVLRILRIWRIKSRLCHRPLVLRILQYLAHEEPAQTSATYFEDFAHLVIWKLRHQKPPEPD